MTDFLFNSEKIKYVKNKKLDVDCILCAIRDGHPDVEKLLIAKTEKFIITLNLYPFNPGQLMIFPIAHIETIDELSDDEVLELHSLSKKAIRILKNEFGATGFNVGYNLGDNSGASIKHLHMHIVPRYGNEIGFMEVISGTRLMVQSPADILDKMKNLW